MEKRLVLAVLLMSAVILITNILFPPEPPPEQADAGAPTVDSTGAPAPAAAINGLRIAPAASATTADTVVVSSPLYRYAFSTRGAALVRAELLQYPSYIERGRQVQLVPEGTLDFLSHRVVVGADTVDLRTLPFRVTESSLELPAGGAPRELRFTYGGNGGFGAEIVYTFRPDSYLVGVRGRLLGVGAQGATLLTEVGPAIAAHEDPKHRSETELAVVAGDPDGVSTVRLEKIEGSERLEGSFAWAGIKDKYFLAALVPGDGPNFTGVVTRELPDAQLAPGPGRKETLALPRAQVTTVLPVGASGEFAFGAYLGPQEHGHMAAVGHGLQEVNPYGYRWLRPVIRPIAAATLWVLELLHNTLGIAYGWVLIIFGVLMRVVLWPLNAKAMRAQMKNMAVQPLMQEIRDKYKDDPQRQQQEMIRLYKEHGFNPLAGCLPLLVPFPVLITLFFVFQSTIEFRGAEFLWLPDLSLPDPYYILPIFLVVSMFGLQWISARTSGMEQNPQMKMMMYFMPLVMGVIFFNFASGLNLYYATTNVATIPQQILIGRERKKAQDALKQEQAAARPAPSSRGGGSGASRKRGAKKRG
jgi:YidC/Oxa1 family membrane protein insertase